MDMNFQAKILKSKAEKSILKLVILAVDVTILLVKMWFFKKFHEKTDAGSP